MSLSRMLGLHDPINRYLVATGTGIGWVLALGRMFYYNPMTYDQTTWWGMWSYNFIKPWMVKFPSDGPLMKLKDLLPEPQLKPGEKRRIARDTDSFHRVWQSCKGSGRFYRKGRASGAFFWLMLCVPVLVCVVRLAVRMRESGSGLMVIDAGLQHCRQALVVLQPRAAAATQVCPVSAPAAGQ